MSVPQFDKNDNRTCAAP